MSTINVHKMIREIETYRDFWLVAEGEGERITSAEARALDAAAEALRTFDRLERGVIGAPTHAACACMTAPWDTKSGECGVCVALADEADEADEGDEGGQWRGNVFVNDAGEPTGTCRGY